MALETYIIQSMQGGPVTCGNDKGRNVFYNSGFNAKAFPNKSVACFQRPALTAAGPLKIFASFPILPKAGTFLCIHFKKV